MRRAARRARRFGRGLNFSGYFYVLRAVRRVAARRVDDAESRILLCGRWWLSDKGTLLSVLSVLCLHCAPFAHVHHAAPSSALCDRPHRMSLQPLRTPRAAMLVVPCCRAPPLWSHARRASRSRTYAVNKTRRRAVVVSAAADEPDVAVFRFTLVHCLRLVWSDACQPR